MEHQDLQGKVVIADDVIYHVIESFNERAKRDGINEGDLISDGMYGYPYDPSATTHSYFVRAVVVYKGRLYYIPSFVNGEMELYSMEGNIDFGKKREYKVCPDVDYMITDMSHHLVNDIDEEEQNEFVKENLEKML